MWATCTCARRTSVPQAHQGESQCDGVAGRPTLPVVLLCKTGEQGPVGGADLYYDDAHTRTKARPNMKRRHLIAVGAVWLVPGSASVAREDAQASLREMARICGQNHDIAIELSADAIQHEIEHGPRRRILHRRRQSILHGPGKVL